MNNSTKTSHSVIPLKEGYSHNYQDIFYKTEWLCQYFTVEYEFYSVPTPMMHENIISLGMNTAIPKETILTSVKKEKITIPLGILLHNRSELYKDYLTPFINFNNKMNLRSKIRNFILYVNHIDDATRRKHQLKLPARKTTR